MQGSDPTQLIVAPVTPERLGKYELRGVVGSGGSGTVFSAWDPDLARRVAIKQVMLAGRTEAERQELTARLRQEARLAGRLSHPGIVAIHDYGEAGDSAYLVMEFVEGETLAAHLQGLRERGQTMAAGRAVAIVQQMLVALEACHRSGVLHRDIKPGNVMLAADGVVKLTDFGIARGATSDLTAHTTLLGTPAYMSPEQFQAGATLDCRSDLYACGVVLYELLTGRKPFEGELYAVMQQIRNEAPPAPSSLVASVPAELDEVVLRAMAKQAADRYPDTASFAAALRHPAATRQFVGIRWVGRRWVGRRWVGPRWVGGGQRLRIAAALTVMMVAASLAWHAGGPIHTADRTPAASVVALGGGAAPVLPRSPAGAAVPGSPNDGPVGASSIDDSSSRLAPGAPDGADASRLAEGANTASPAATDGVDAASLATQLRALPCTALAVRPGVDPGTSVVHGLARLEIVRGELASLLNRQSGRIRAEELQVFEALGAACLVADLVRAAPSSDLRIDLADGRTHLAENEAIRVSLRMPDFAGEVRLDYLTDSGQTIVHLHPAHRLLPRFAAAAVVPLGPDGDGVIGRVGPPFGSDLILVTVADRSLPIGARPSVEAAEPYLRLLQTMASEAVGHGAKIAAGAVMLETAVSQRPGAGAASVARGVAEPSDHSQSDRAKSPSLGGAEPSGRR